MIRCTWYFSTGRESHTHDCNTPREAFDRLVRTDMDAIAYEVKVKVGPTYVWRQSQAGHTYEAFCKKLEVAE